MCGLQEFDTQTLNLFINFSENICIMTVNPQFLTHYLLALQYMFQPENRCGTTWFHKVKAFSKTVSLPLIDSLFQCGTMWFHNYDSFQATP
jgi:hypothetical protein